MGAGLHPPKHPSRCSGWGHSERTQGFAADPDYVKGEVFAYVGRNQNLKELKDHVMGFRVSESACHACGRRCDLIVCRAARTIEFAGVGEIEGEME